MEPPDNKRELPRKLGTLDATAIERGVHVTQIALACGLGAIPGKIPEQIMLFKHRFY